MKGIILLFFLLVLLTVTASPHPLGPKIWHVGLRGGQTLENHVKAIGVQIPIEERRPEINGYSTSFPDIDKEAIETIRKDPMVGFVVKTQRDHFSRVEKIVESTQPWSLDDSDFYEPMLQPTYHWHTLSDMDPEVLVADNGGIKVPLKWYVELEDDYDIDEHLGYIQGKITPLRTWKGPATNSYYFRFASEKQEQELYPSIRDDPRVVSISPMRAHKMEDVILDRDL